MFGNIMPVYRVENKDDGLFINPSNKFLIPSEKSLYTFKAIATISDVSSEIKKHSVIIQYFKEEKQHKKIAFNAQIPHERFASGKGVSTTFTFQLTNIEIDGSGIYTFSTTVDGKPLNDFQAKFEVK